MISAANSYDQDVQGLTGATAGLQFAWSCVQIAPFYADHCGNTLTLSTATSETVTVIGGMAAVNTTSRLTVRVFDSTRSSTAFTDALVISTAVNALTITTAASTLGNVLTNQQFSLAASLDVRSACTATWAVDDSTVILADALTASTKAFGLGSYKFNLVLAADKLPERATLLFSLKCGLASTGKPLACALSCLCPDHRPIDVEVTTNGAPLPGSFLVLPDVATDCATCGNELSTSFTFTASDFSDTDLPLSYEFSFYSPSSAAYLVVQGKSQTSYAMSTLPAGPAPSNALLCMVKVFDSFDASSNSKNSVIVRELDPAEQAAALNSMFEDIDPSDVDAQKGTVSIASTVMNRVNCTLPAGTNCSLLHRAACSATPFTCGKCFDGFLGDDGDANSECIDADSLFSRRLSAGCTGGCSALQTCIADACMFNSRACVSNCSGHGSCHFIDSSTGQELSDCKVNDLTCTAQCHCAANFTGQACAIADADLVARRKLRESLISTLKNVISNDDVSSSSLSSWSAYLESVSSNPYDLSSNGLSTVRTLALLTTQYAQGVLDYKALQGVLNAVDALTSIVYLDYKADASGASASNKNIGGGVIDILTSYADVISRSLIYGQADVNIVKTNFRILGAYLDIGAARTASIVVPKSTAEKSAGVEQSSLKLVPSASAADDEQVCLFLLSEVVRLLLCALRSLPCVPARHPLLPSCPLYPASPYLLSHDANALLAGGRNFNSDLCQAICHRWRVLLRSYPLQGHQCQWKRCLRAALQRRILIKEQRQQQPDL